MSKPEVTPWFPASVKPVRTGWYEVVFDYEDTPEKRYYSVSLDRWRLSPRGVGSVFGDWMGYADKWRGLTKKA